MDTIYRPRSMPDLLNVMEYVVSATVDDVLKEECFCHCPRCRLDVMALALNDLPAKYVSTMQGRAYEIYRHQGNSQSRIAVYQAVLRAAQQVNAQPRHRMTTETQP